MTELIKPEDGQPYYQFGDRKEPRVSNVLSLLQEPWWTNFVKKQTRGVILEHWEELALLTEDEGAFHKAVRDIPEDTAKRDLGTDVHAAIEDHLTDSAGFWGEEVTPYVDQFVKWFECVDEVLFTELTVFGPGYAGTVDLICVIDGAVSLVDYKTGQYPRSHKYLMQLAAYGHADFAVSPPGEQIALPHSERYAVLHLQPDSHEFIEFPGAFVDTAWARFQDLVRVHQFLNDRSFIAKEKA